MGALAVLHGGARRSKSLGRGVAGRARLRGRPARTSGHRRARRLRAVAVYLAAGSRSVNVVPAPFPALCTAIEPPSCFM